MTPESPAQLASRLLREAQHQLETRHGVTIAHIHVEPVSGAVRINGDPVVLVPVGVKR